MRGDLEAVGSWWVQKATSNPCGSCQGTPSDGSWERIPPCLLFLFIVFSSLASYRSGVSRRSLAGDSLILVSGFT